MQTNVEPSTIECDVYSQISTSQDNSSLSSMNTDITPEEPLKIVTVEKKMHMCLTCGKDFMSTSNLNQYMKIHSSEKSFVCDKCQKSFVRKWDLTRHLNTHDTGENSAFKCEKVFTQKDNLKHHLRSHKFKISLPWMWLSVWARNLI